MAVLLDRPMVLYSSKIVVRYLFFPLNGLHENLLVTLYYRIKSKLTNL